MVPLVPRADSLTGRALSFVGHLLGLRSETVYSRAILLVALCQFVVLGLAVTAVWLASSNLFLKAAEARMLSAASRAAAFFASHSGPVVPLASTVAAISGYEVEWSPFAADQMGTEPWWEGEDANRRVMFPIPAHGDRPPGVLAMRQGREVSNTGPLVMRTFVVGLALAGGLMLLIMLLVVDRTVVGRIQLLAAKVESEKISGQLPVRLDFPGDDELAMLARSMEELARKVQQAEWQYRQVVEDQTEGICRFDAEGRITFANKAFGALCVSPPVGESPLLAACLGSEVRSAVERALSACTPHAPISQFLHAGPGECWYRSVLRANFDEAGRAEGGQWIASEMTREVIAHRQLEDSQRQLARLSARLLNLQDEERRRIARDLHDSTAQDLSALEMNMSVLESLTGEGKARELAAETRAICRQVCRELRNISYLLHPPLLEEEGLAFAIRWFADGFTKRADIPVVLALQDDFPRLGAETETSLFRIVQEALSNIYRHSGASKAWITLQLGSDARGILEIRDNGSGLPEGFSREKSAGVGLAGMQERMAQLGGTLDVITSAYGVAVRCDLPIAEAQERKEDIADV